MRTYTLHASCRFLSSATFGLPPSRGFTRCLTAVAARFVSRKRFSSYGVRYAVRLCPRLSRANAIGMPSHETAESLRRLRFHPTCSEMLRSALVLLSLGTVCVRAAEHADDGDSLARIVDPVEHAVGAAAGTVAVIQWWS
jgi:hypothetical protein